MAASKGKKPKGKYEGGKRFSELSKERQHELRSQWARQAARTRQRAQRAKQREALRAMKARSPRSIAARKGAYTRKFNASQMGKRYVPSVPEEGVFAPDVSARGEVNGWHRLTGVEIKNARAVYAEGVRSAYMKGMWDEAKLRGYMNFGPHGSQQFAIMSSITGADNAQGIFDWVLSNNVIAKQAMSALQAAWEEFLRTGDIDALYDAMSDVYEITSPIDGETRAPIPDYDYSAYTESMAGLGGANLPLDLL